MLRIGVCLFLATFVAAPLRADEIDDFFKKVDSLRYSPVDHGLKDVKVEVKNSMYTAMMPNLKIFLYWKSPDKKTAKVEGLEGPAAAAGAQMAKGMEALVGIIIPQPYHDMRADLDFVLEKDAEGVKVVATPKPGNKMAQMFTKQTTWFGENGLPTRLETEGKMPGHRTMKFLEKDGSFLLDSMDGEQTTPMSPQPVKQTLTMHYTQIEGIWLAESVDQEIGDRKITSTMEGYEVNKGIDDSVFESKDGGK